MALQGTTIDGEPFPPPATGASDLGATLVVIEDNEVDALMVREYVAEASVRPMKVRVATRLSDAVVLLQGDPPLCVLLDLGLPDASGLEALDVVSATWPELPIIVQTGLQDEDTANEALHRGAQDYLIKGKFDADTLLRAIRYAVERKSSERALRHRALHDPVTDLPNRSMFLERLRVALDRAARQGNFVGVMMLDLDRFKWINDSMGHEAGDLVLVEVGRRISGAIRPFDLVARHGGDEFLVLCEELVTPLDSGAVAERILAALEADIVIRGSTVCVKASVGIAVHRGVATGEDLVGAADAAMYRAKGLGGGQVAFFDQALRAAAYERLEIERGLREAIAAGGIVVHFQPIVALDSGRAIGAEALVRCRSDEGDLLAPDRFIEVAEETGLILDIGDCVLRVACAEVSRWPETLDGQGPSRVSVNISGRELEERSFVDRISRVLSDTGLDPRRLCLELTESSLLHDEANSARVLAELATMGIVVALDDFGTGFSSLTRLTHLPVGQVKIDRSFTANLGQSTSAAAIVEAVLAIGSRLDLQVVAEGVETPAQSKLLRAMGCERAQGYLYSHPVPADDLLALLAGGTLQ